VNTADAIAVTRGRATAADLAAVLAVLAVLAMLVMVRAARAHDPAADPETERP